MNSNFYNKKMDVRIGTIIIFYIALEKEKRCAKKDKILKEENERTTSFITETVRGSKDIKMLNVLV